MTETSSAQPSLTTMRLAELQQLASSMGLKGTSRLRKSELVAAIREAGPASAAPTRAARKAASATKAPAQPTASAQPAEGEEQPRPRRRRATAPAAAPKHEDLASLELDLPARSQEQAPARGRAERVAHDEVVSGFEAREAGREG